MQSAFRGSIYMVPRVGDWNVVIANHYVVQGSCFIFCSELWGLGCV